MPAAACPGTVQRYSKMPFFRRTVRIADLPWASNIVPFPLQPFAEPPLLLEQILKLCGRRPWFVTLNVTVPGLTFFVESLNCSSVGFPAVTVTVCSFAPAVCAVEPLAERAPQVTRHADASSPKAILVRNEKCLFLSALSIVMS